MLSTLSIVALAAAAAAFFDPFTAGDDPCPHSTCPNCPNKEYDQCGGQGWTGPTCCLPYDKCTVINPYYSQCQPTDFCKTPDFGQCNGTDKGQPIPKDHQCCPPSFECNATDPPYYSQCIPSNVTSNCSQPYGQCGGKDWTGPTCCIPGYVCNKTSDYCAPPPPAQSPAPRDRRPRKSRAPRDRRRPSAAFCAADSGCDPEPFCANPRYGQCGGQDPSGKPYTPACCPPGFHCESKSQYYSQCVPDDPPFVAA